MTSAISPKIVMAGRVPTIQTHRPRLVDRGVRAADPSATPALLGGRDKPGHDGQEGWI